MARTKQHRRRQSSGSVSGAALTLATILLLALSLWFGMRQNGKASARISRTLPARKIATDAAKALAADSPGGSTRPSPAVFDLKSRSAGVAAASNRSRTRSGGAHKRTKHANGNYIAPDTVIYFDKRIAEEAAARAKPAKQPSKQQTPSGSDSGGAVAANAVTDFDDKGAAKTVKQDSSVKPVSPPN
jgi:hypothetical protein